ncbi:retrovirus-related pol polyprotein from transposon TNT 1-94 [Tanacetum coccineum]
MITSQQSLDMEIMFKAISRYVTYTMLKASDTTLLLVRQFCDGDLELAFCSNTFYVWNLEGDDLLTGSHEPNLYTISISELVASSPVCLMSKATSTKSWLWHRRLSHLNFTCEQGKSKKDSFPSQLVPRTESKLELIHMDLYGPMRVYFLRTKDEAPDTIINFINQVQRNFKAQILKIRTDNGTESKNEKLQSFYAKLGINCSIVHTQYNKTPYELIRGRKPNVQYFYVFGSLCYSTNDRDDLRKIKPKADIGIFIGYSESSRGFRIYNRRTKRIMETIDVKFDELTTMASECNNLEPKFNYTNFQDSSKDSQSLPSKIDLDNLFGPLYEEYYSTSSPEVSDNSAANTLDNENTSSSSSIVVEEDEAPPIVSSSTEQVASEQNTPVLIENADEVVQEDVTEFDGNVFYYPPQILYSKKLSHLQYIRIHQICTMSTTELKNIKEAMLDASWIESMQDELNKFKRLDVWELVKCPIGRNIIAVKWIWKNKTDAKNTVIRNKSHLVAKGYGQEEGIDFE